MKRKYFIFIIFVILERMILNNFFEKIMKGRHLYKKLKKKNEDKFYDIIYFI